MEVTIEQARTSYPRRKNFCAEASHMTEDDKICALEKGAILHMVGDNGYVEAWKGIDNLYYCYSRISSSLEITTFYFAMACVEAFDNAYEHI